LGVLRVTDPDQSERLAQLEAKIAAAKAEFDPKPHLDDHYTQAHMAWRMVIELVAGLMIGFGIGYGLDSLFGTLPLFLVIFILLGLVAGIRVMLRTAQEAQDKNLAAEVAKGNDEEGA